MNSDMARYVDLSEQSEDIKGVLNLASVNDILQICKIETHKSPEATEWDQIISAMTSIAKWAPVGMFRSTVHLCDCVTANKATRVQTIVFIGLAGYLCVAKEITQLNKSYVTKRWAAYCAGAKIINLLTDSKQEALLALVITNQAKLHQSELGRQFAERAITHDMSTPKVRDQILLVYSYSGMKASLVMYEYLAEGPMALYLPTVAQDARTFKDAYEKLLADEREMFAYSRVLGRGEALNHSNFPDLYYCAVSSSKKDGKLGGKDSKFVRSSLPTKASQSQLDRVCRIASAGVDVSDANMERWKTVAAELGVTVSEADVKRAKRRLRDDDSDADDDDGDARSKRRR